MNAKLSRVSLFLLMGCLVAGLAAAGDSEEHKIVIKKIHQCEGEDCEHTGAFLGVQLTGLTEELRQHFGAPAEAGVMVSKVVVDSPAEAAGLGVGDIITAVDGEAISSASELVHGIRGRKEGDAVDLDVYRDGGLQIFSATLGERETDVRMAHRVVVDCDEGEDCPEMMAGFDFDFDFDCEDCKVMVQCEDEECTCTVNGEPADCDELGLPRHHE